MHYFFGQGEDSWLAGDEQEAVMGFAAEPARPAEATIVQGAIEAMARHRFGDETSQTFHLRAPAFYAAASTKGIPLSVGHGDCMFHRHVAPRGRIGERPPRFVSESGHQFSASGVRLPVFGFGAGLTDQEARTPVPFWLAEGAKSPLAGRLTVWVALLHLLPCYSVPFP